MFDEYDLRMNRRKVYLEAVDEGARLAAIMDRLENEVGTLAMADNLNASLTPVANFECLRREFGCSSMSWDAHAAHKDRRHHAGETSLDFLRHCFLARIKVSLYIVRHEEGIHATYPLVQESAPSAFGIRQAAATIQGTSDDVVYMGQHQSHDIGTQTAQWQGALLNPLLLAAALHSPPLLGIALHSLLNVGTGCNNSVVRPALRLPQVFI
ncbi:unnamed protein product [Schistocephalus solidus]|uniref:Uncharacterized protein n=1 Tax=Schistocephalus solidus TaxID=70667 RepID=A0A183SNK0_SCHSO|nr:unnamed protein product [Schistocephalus solidus]